MGNQQALAEMTRRINEAAQQFAASMVAAADVIAPRIAGAAEQTRQNIIAATDRTKAL